MKHLKPERVAGIVALSYLVLIPAGAYLAYRKIQAMDQDITTLWDHAEINPKEQAEPKLLLPNIRGVGEMLRSRVTPAER